MNADSISTVLMITNDLFFSSKVEGIAQKLGARLEVVPEFDPAVWSDPEKQPALLILDLASPRLDVARILSAFPADQRPDVIAYGAHVAKARLDQARAMGCDEVLTRGQFASRLSEILGRHFEN